MTRTLLLLRHGKSDWGQGMDDHERPLSKRGKRDAWRMGEEIRTRGLLPEMILSSTARRARSTTRRVVEASGYGGEVIYEPSLYAAGMMAYVEAAANLSDSVQTALIVGHNPILEDLVRWLTGREVTLPTAALACIPLPIQSWGDLRQEGSGTLGMVLAADELG